MFCFVCVCAHMLGFGGDGTYQACEVLQKCLSSYVTSNNSVFLNSSRKIKGPKPTTAQVTVNLSAKVLQQSCMLS